MEKRNFFRLSMREDFEFSVLDPVTVDVLSNSNKGILHDISGGGLSFSTKMDLDKNQLLEIKLSNDGNLFLLIGKVVRKINRENQDLYAVEFVHLDRHTQDQLVQLIFNMQRRERKKLGGGQ